MKFTSLAVLSAVSVVADAFVPRSSRLAFRGGGKERTLSKCGDADERSVEIIQNCHRKEPPPHSLVCFQVAVDDRKSSFDRGSEEGRQGRSSRAFGLGHT